MVCGGRKLPTRAGSDFSLSLRRSYGKLDLRDHVVTTHTTLVLIDTVKKRHSNTHNSANWQPFRGQA